MSFKESSPSTTDSSGAPPEARDLLTSLASGNAMSPIQPELRWRQAPPALVLPGGQISGITLSRWSATTVPQPVEAYQDAVEDAHVISYAVRPTVMSFSDSHLDVRETAIRRQALLLTPPTENPRRAVFYQPYDIVRAYISQQLLKECWISTYGTTRSQHISLFETRFSQHSDLIQLMRCVLDEDTNAAPLDLVFLEALGLALSSQLLRIGIGRAPEPRKRTALNEARVRRVIDYVEAHLAEPIYLADLANIVGLSRMHFAAQFRAATGLSPHAFILQRRINRSKTLLSDEALTISEVALSTGFNGQAHFSEQFRKVVDDTPYRWRKALIGDGTQRQAPPARVLKPSIPTPPKSQRLK